MSVEYRQGLYFININIAQGSDSSSRKDFIKFLNYMHR